MLNKCDFTEALQRHYLKQQKLSPTLVLKFKTLTAAIQHQITVFYRSRNVPVDCFCFTNDCLFVYYAPLYAKLKCILPEHEKVMSAEFPNLQDGVYSRTISYYSNPVNCALCYPRFLRECQLLECKYQPNKQLVLIDFEAFSTSNPISISEVGISIIDNKKIEDFHCFFEYKKNFNEEEAKIANIPMAKIDNEYYQDISYLARFLANDPLIFAKGTDLERRILRQQLSWKKEVFEIQALLALYGQFDILPGLGTRCRYHQHKPGHCALQDVTGWAEKIFALL